MLMIVAPVLLFASGCASRNSRQGVENLWRSSDAPAFVKGRTTRQEVMAVLGPPSQLINLEDQTVLYYLREQKKSQSVILVVYNQTREDIIYDRAIFFFDKRGRLTDFALSNETVPTD